MPWSDGEEGMQEAGYLGLGFCGGALLGLRVLESSAQG